jgi:hypothetical protein
MTKRDDRQPVPPPSQEYIFRMFITVNGKKIYRKNGRPFKIPINRKK